MKKRNVIDGKYKHVQNEIIFGKKTKANINPYYWKQIEIFYTGVDVYNVNIQLILDLTRTGANTPIGDKFLL